jgi:hypothetical protein
MSWRQVWRVFPSTHYFFFCCPQLLSKDRTGEQLSLANGDVTGPLNMLANTKYYDSLADKSMSVPPSLESGCWAMKFAKEGPKWEWHYRKGKYAAFEVFYYQLSIVIGFLKTFCHNHR